MPMAIFHGWSAQVEKPPFITGILQLNEAAARRGTVIEAARSIKTASAEG